MAPIDKLSVLLAAVFAFTFLGERSSFREGLEILLVGAGVLDNCGKALVPVTRRSRRSDHIRVLR